MAPDPTTPTRGRRLMHLLGAEDRGHTFCGRPTHTVKSWAFPWVARELALSNICGTCRRSHKRRGNDPKLHEFPLPGGTDA